MGLEVTTIDTRINKLYNTEFANFSLFYPFEWFVPSLNSEDGTKKNTLADGNSIYNIMESLTKYADSGSITTTFPEKLMHCISTIGGIPSTSSGFKAEGAGLKEEKDNNYATITVKFYETEKLEIWRWMNNWRAAWKDIKFNVATATTAPATTACKKIATILNDDGTKAMPEGFLCLQHLSFKNDGTIEELGRLKIAGMIPTEVPFPSSEIGPGKSRGSDIPNLSVKFTASNIVYTPKKGGIIQIY